MESSRRGFLKGLIASSVGAATVAGKDTSALQEKVEVIEDVKSPVLKFYVDGRDDVTIYIRPTCEFHGKIIRKVTVVTVSPSEAGCENRYYGESVSIAKILDIVRKHYKKKK